MNLLKGGTRDLLTQIAPWDCEYLPTFTNKYMPNVGKYHSIHGAFGLRCGWKK